MDAEEILKKFDVGKLGFWFWIILFGFFDIIFSIINDQPDYIPLGLYFFACGGFGYFVSTYWQQCSAKNHPTKPVQEITVIEKTVNEKTETQRTITEKRVIDPPDWYFIVTSLIKLAILFLLCWLILRKYPNFWPFSNPF
jgi:hypothetical protein